MFMVHVPDILWTNWIYLNHPRTCLNFVWLSYLKNNAELLWYEPNQSFELYSYGGAVQCMSCLKIADLKGCKRGLVFLVLTNTSSRVVNLGICIPKYNRNINVCKTLMAPFPNIYRMSLTFDTDLWPSTDLDINKGHLLIKVYLPTKFEVSGAKRSWIISCTKWTLTLTLTYWPEYQ